jgi:hypothetical protein
MLWGDVGLDYKAMYFQLAAKVADAVDLLVSAQQQGEAQFAEQDGDAGLVLLKRDEGSEDE